MKFTMSRPFASMVKAVLYSETNLHATAVQIVPLPSDEEVALTCSSCEKSIENGDFVLCILCEYLL
jgi:hypothetical protein